MYEGDEWSATAFMRILYTDIRKMIPSESTGVRPAMGLGRTGPQAATGGWKVKLSL